MNDSCKNCKYYVAHYVKGSTRLQEIDGHCIQEKVNRKHKWDRRVLDDPCDYREEGDPNERKRNIIKILQNMDKHLADIALLLADEYSDK